MARLGVRTAEMFALRFLEGHSDCEIVERNRARHRQ
jgi:hypothetical protein